MANGKSFHFGIEVIFGMTDVTRWRASGLLKKDTMFMVTIAVPKMDILRRSDPQLLLCFFVSPYLS